MLEVGKLYRHHMIRTHPGVRILGCIVYRGVDGDWIGGIDTIAIITDYAESLMFVEMSEAKKSGIFLAGDRFVMIDVELVEAL